MLLGRIFQNKTYDTLSFERDYKSFFPIAVMCRKNGVEASVPVSDLKKGDRMIIRNEELIPADAYLLKGEANIDYSFVTGESVPLRKKAGELIYAGGKQVGASIELEVVSEVRQSYLTQLWNSDAYTEKHRDTKFQQLVNKISHYFTFAIVGVALASLAFWFFKGDSSRGWNAFTAVLIIACPCALAISSPFTLGNILRIFGRNKFYLKNFAVIEKLALVDTVVFDKTGTITYNNEAAVEFVGEDSDELRRAVRSVVSHSTHPLSRMIFTFLKADSILPVKGFHEEPGKGISASVNDVEVKIGSAGFVKANADSGSVTRTLVYVSVNGITRG
jgi:Cu+-exporting ATPase